eukprot:g1970.t1
MSDQYWCHECQKNVSITNENDDELICSECNGCFVEAYDGEAHGEDNPAEFIPSSASAASTNFGRGAGRSSSPNSSANDNNNDNNTNPQVMSLSQGLQSIISQVISGLGEPNGGTGGNGNRSSGFQVHTLNIGSFGGGGIASNLGNYSSNAGLENLLNQMLQASGSGRTTRPTSKKTLASLPRVQIEGCPHGSGKGAEDCAVCKENLNIGEEAIRLPCQHCYHPSCIIPWLEKHNSCPVCRTELPTDDAQYNASHGIQTESSASSV